MAEIAKTRKIFIGVAWPYANGAMHLGHIAGSLLAPDIFSRYHRMRGNRVLMVSGSDMHGTPITVTAEKEGVEPEVIAERYHEMNHKAIQDMQIKFDLYLKTSHPDHKKVVQEIFRTHMDKGYIYEKVIEAFYCSDCQRYLPDRYVEGECPHCNAQGARGDQCDECGKTLDPLELTTPICKLCSSTPVVQETKHLFFKFSAFQSKLEKYVSDKKHWRKNTINFTKNWLKIGIRDRAVTRDLQWGIEIPVDGFQNKRIYVWFEAVMGYFSMSKAWAERQGNPELWQDFWKDAECRHYYFLGKDNIPFHTIIWPAILMGYDQGLNLPYDVPANEFLRMSGEQFSKSRGISISVNDLLQKYDADQLRYYLTVNMPENRDYDFTWEDFYSKINNELVSTLGNFIHRVLSFSAKHFEKVPEAYRLRPEDEKAIAAINEKVDSIAKSLEACEFKPAIRGLMDLAQFGNQYIDQKAPWKSRKDDIEDCETGLHICLRMVKALAITGAPFMPQSMDKVWSLLGYRGTVHESCWEDAKSDVPTGRPLQIPKPVFRPIEVEKDDTAEANEKPDAKPDTKAAAKPDTSLVVDSEREMDDMKNLDLRIGTVIEIKNHPNADKLYVMQVDLGSERRQLVAGLRPYYEMEELEGSQIVVICNLKAAVLRGEPSQGMLFAADDAKGTVTALRPTQPVEPGTRLKGTTAAKEMDFKQFLGYEIKTGRIKPDHKTIDVGRDVELHEPHEPGNAAAVISKVDSRAYVLETENNVPLLPDREITRGSEIH
jgi:methionyl-tRNA synthetase